VPVSVRQELPMSPRRPRFSVQPAQQFVPTWPELLALCQEAERLGFDSIYTFDHLTSVAIMTDPFDPSLEAWTILGALATATRRIRLGTLVSGNTYRHPGLLAKMATTVDTISGGRLDFGIGAGWYAPEHAMYGIPFRTAAERCAMLDEALSVIRRLWTESETSFAGRYYTLERAIAEPKPLQRPHPPILVAASGEKRMLRVVARHADMWNSFGSPETFRHKIAVLADHCRAEGRDVDRIEKSVLLPTFIGHEPAAWEPMVQGYAMYQGIAPEEAGKWMLLGSPAEVVDQLRRFLAVGVTHFIIQLNVFNLGVMARFAAEVMPALTAEEREGSA
jgi:F420-dependent oxidoreductase-like protein